MAAIDIPLDDFIKMKKIRGSSRGGGNRAFIVCILSETCAYPGGSGWISSVELPIGADRHADRQFTANFCRPIPIRSDPCWSAIFTW